MVGEIMMPERLAVFRLSVLPVGDVFERLLLLPLEFLRSLEVLSGRPKRAISSGLLGHELGNVSIEPGLRAEVLRAPHSCLRIFLLLSDLGGTTAQRRMSGFFRSTYANS